MSSPDDDPFRPLQAIQAALEAAARSDNAPAIAECLFAHVRMLLSLHARSPLKVVRDGELGRAWELADLHDPERSILWHLLLAWELEGAGKTAEARATLERLLPRQLPRLGSGYWQAAHAVFLLAQVVSLDEDACDALQERLLEDRERQDLCERIAKRGHSDAAYRIGERIRDKHDRGRTIAGVAKSLAEAGDYEGAIYLAECLPLQSDGSERGLADVAIAQARAGDWYSAWWVARDLFALSYKGEALREVAIARTKAGELEAAREMFAEAVECFGYQRDRVWLSGDIVETAVAQAELGDYRGALESVRKIPLVYKIAEALREIASVQARHGEDDAARENFAKAAGLTQVPDFDGGREYALVHTSEAEAQAGFFDDAFETAALILDPRYRAEALAKVAAAQAQAGDVDAARETFARAIEQADGIELPSDRARALLDVAEAQVNAREFDAAVGTVRMNSSDSDLCLVLTGIAAETVRIEDRARAHEVLADVIEDLKGLGSGDRTRVLHSVCDAHRKAGEFARALDTARGMRRAGERAWAFRQVAEAQAEAGDVRVCRETLAVTLSGPGEAEREAARLPRALSEIAVEQAKAGRFPVALEIADQISDPSLKVPILCELGVARAAAGRHLAALKKLVAAVEEAEKVEDPEERVRALALAGSALLRAGTPSEAGRAFWLAEEAVAAIDDEGSDRAYALLRIARAQARGAEFDSALETAGKIAKGSIRSDALRDIALEIAKAGAAIDWKALFDSAIEAALVDQSREWSTGDLCSIAAAQVEAGDGASARATFLRVFDLAKSLRASPDPEFPSSTRFTEGWQRVLIALAKTLLEVGFLDAAYWTARVLMRPDYLERGGSLFDLDDILRDIARAHVRAGDLHRAIAVTWIMSTAKQWDREAKISAWNTIAVAQAKAGLREAARSRFSSALHVAYQSDWEDSDRVEERASELAVIAEAQVEAGEVESADENFDAALEMATGLDDDYRRPRALHAIVAAQAGAGKYSDAIATAERIEDGTQESALKKIAIIQAERGLGEDAVRTAELIIKSKEVHLPEIAEALIGAGDREHFKRLLLPCAHDPESAGKMFLLLLKAYPRQAGRVVERVAG